MKQPLLQIGEFPDFMLSLITAEFEIVRIQEVENDPQLQATIRGIVTRSNYCVPEDLVLSLPQLGIIATCGVGYDQIPLSLAYERGIHVTNTPDVLNSAVAELTVGSILALLRQIPQADRFVKGGQWLDQTWPLAQSLAGKHVGIVGLGRIGKAIANVLQPFGVTLSYFGRTQQKVPFSYYESIGDLARASDILILAAPGGDETRHIVDSEVLAALGDQGYLINIARGSLVDEEALIAALSTRAIAGAALDVYQQEPKVNPALFELDNVLLAPHMGSATYQTRHQMVTLVLDNLRRYFAGESLLTPVIGSDFSNENR